MIRYNKGNALLIELLIVLLFFTLSQTIVVQVFAKAQQTNQEAESLNRALVRAEDAAEMLAVSDDPEETLASLGFSEVGGTYRYAMDGHCEVTASVTRFTQPSGQLTTITLTACRDGETLFTLPAVRYRGVTAQ